MFISQSAPWSPSRFSGALSWDVTLLHFHLNIPLWVSEGFCQVCWHSQSSKAVQLVMKSGQEMPVVSLTHATLHWDSLDM